MNIFSLFKQWLIKEKQSTKEISQITETTFAPPIAEAQPLEKPSTKANQSKRLSTEEFNASIQASLDQFFGDPKCETCQLTLKKGYRFCPFCAKKLFSAHGFDFSSPQRGDAEMFPVYQDYAQTSGGGSIIKLAECHYMGSTPNGVRDFELAASLFRQAAEAGEVEAISYLARFYEFGIGVTKDKQKAFEYYK